MLWLGLATILIPRNYIYKKKVLWITIMLITPVLQSLRQADRWGSLATQHSQTHNILAIKTHVTRS